MQQVFLGLAALAIAMLLSLNTRGVTSQTDLASDETQITLMAANVLGEAFAEVAMLPYDEVLEADTVAQLTPSAGFGGTTWDAAADMDDLHGATLTQTRVLDGVPMSFSVSATVEYVRKSGTAYVPSSTPEAFKRVRLRLAAPMGVSVDARRVFAWHGLQVGA